MPVTGYAPAGARRHLVTLQSLALTADGDGEPTGSPMDLEPAQMWASIEPATAQNLSRLVAGTFEAVATHIVKFPYRADVTTQSQIIFGTRTLNVLSIQNPKERNRQLILICSEVVP